MPQIKGSQYKQNDILHSTWHTYLNQESINNIGLGGDGGVGWNMYNRLKDNFILILNPKM